MLVDICEASSEDSGTQSMHSELDDNQQCLNVFTSAFAMHLFDFSTQVIENLIQMHASQAEAIVSLKTCCV